MKWQLKRKGCEPKQLFLKAFFPCGLLCLIAGNRFFRVQSFFVSLVAAIYSSTEKNSHELAIYNLFDGYFYLRRIVISKEHFCHTFQWYHQKAFSSDLVFSKVLCFFETRTCIYLFLQKY